MTDSIHKGWFSEVNQGFWPGQALSLEMDGEPMWNKKSEYQDVLVFKNKGPWGTVFCLDGAIQVTDKDEFSYHEMLANLPVCSHPEPKNVLIIGGGDGGVMREVLKTKSVETCTLCDIDAMVPEISRKFFPHLSCSFDDPRATLLVGDGFKFLEDKVDAYDVIIVDSSDPDGPASTLFGKDFYSRCRKALRPGGVIATQGESYWIHLDLIKSMVKFQKEIGFKHVEYANIAMPTYPCGGIGFFICSDERSCATPAREHPEEVANELKMYSKEMHTQAFILPPFVKRALADC